MRDAQEQDTIQGLRELADFLETHPGVPMPCIGNLNAFVNLDTLPKVARMASWKKHYMDTWFVLQRQFSGDVELHVNIERAQVCRKVVTGKKVIPARPEQEVEEYEWVCEETSILAGGV